jgi:hypothetical protein
MKNHTTNTAPPPAHAHNATNPITTPTTDSPPPDGPCHPFTFRHRGKVIDDQMQPAAWNMVDCLWQQPELAATFADLKDPVYDDREHLAGNEAFGALRRDANAFFKARHGLARGPPTPRIA